MSDGGETAPEICGAGRESCIITQHSWRGTKDVSCGGSGSRTTAREPCVLPVCHSTCRRDTAAEQPPCDGAAAGQNRAQPPCSHGYLSEEKCGGVGLRCHLSARDGIAPSTSYYLGYGGNNMPPTETVVYRNGRPSRLSTGSHSDTHQANADESSQPVCTQSYQPVGNLTKWLMGGCTSG